MNRILHSLVLLGLCTGVSACGSNDESSTSPETGDGDSSQGNTTGEDDEPDDMQDTSEPENGVSHCSGGESLELYEYIPNMGGNGRHACDEETEAYSNLPNKEVTDIVSVELPQPIVAGEPYAFSFEDESTQATPHTMEVWGAHSQCGAPVELLWWSERAPGVQCGEVLAEDAYTHIHFVRRSGLASSFTPNIGEFNACSQGAGACGGGTTGSTRTDGAPPLEAPLGSFRSVSTRLSTQYQFGLDGGGHVRLLPASGSQTTIEAGVFRLPSGNEYADAWYCVGEGTTYLRTEDADGDSTYDVRLRGITKLPDCTVTTGEETATLTDAEEDSVVSSITWLGGYDSVLTSCSGTTCRVSTSGQNADGRSIFGFMELVSSVDLGSQSEPSLMVGEVTLAEWLVRPDSSGPMGIACASSGTVSYDPQGTSEVQLTNLSTIFTCPGEPVDASSFDMRIQ